MKKGVLLILGMLLIFFGFIISLGATAEFLEGSSEESVIGDMIVFTLVGIAPIAVGGFLCWRALPQRGSGRATAGSVVHAVPINASMKGFFLVVGILLILFGGNISLGAAIEFLEGSSEEHVIANIIGLMLLGIAPIAGGGFLCWRTLSQRGSNVE